MRKQNAVFKFAFKKEEPFINNLAEKIKQKISNRFHIFTGADIFARRVCFNRQKT